MNKDKLKEVCAVRRNEMIGIACFMAGVAVTNTKFGKNRKGPNISTEIAVGQIGKLGELLIQRGHNASDQVVRWSITMAKK